MKARKTLRKRSKSRLQRRRTLRKRSKSRLQGGIPRLFKSRSSKQKSLSPPPLPLPPPPPKSDLLNSARMHFGMSQPTQSNPWGYGDDFGQLRKSPEVQNLLDRFPNSLGWSSTHGIYGSGKKRKHYRKKRRSSKRRSLKKRSLKRRSLKRRSKNMRSKKR